MGKTNAHTHITTLLGITATIKTKTHSKMPQESEEGKKKKKE